MKAIAILPLVVAQAVLAALPAYGAAGTAKKPNVIIVLTDDQGYGDLSCHGNPVLKTPNLDRLWAESVRLTDFHAAPMCTPTRGQLLSGVDCLRNGAMNVSSGRTFLRRGLPTMADVFAGRRLPLRPVRQVAPRRQLSLPPAGPRLSRVDLVPVVAHRQRARLLEQRLLRRHVLPQRTTQAVHGLHDRRVFRAGDPVDADRGCGGATVFLLPRHRRRARAAVRAAEVPRTVPGPERTRGAVLRHDRQHRREPGPAGRSSCARPVCGTTRS